MSDNSLSVTRMARQMGEPVSAFLQSGSFSLKTTQEPYGTGPDSIESTA
jgi:hypothetical protein